MDEGAQAIRRALQGFPILTDVLSPEQLDRLAERCRPAFFAAGSTLMTQGEPGASVYCVTEGVVRIVYVDPVKRERKTRKIEAGTVVGEIEVLTGEPRKATVTAFTDVHALEIDKPVFDDLFAKTPELMESLGAVRKIRLEILDQIVNGTPKSLIGRSWERMRNGLANVLSGRRIR